MKWILFGCLVLLVLLVAIIITKLRVYISYYHAQDDDSLKIEFKAFFGLIKYKLDIPLIKVDDNSPTMVVKGEVQSGKDEKTMKKAIMQFSADDIINTLKDMKTLLEHVVLLHRIIRHFCTKVTIKKLEWHSIIGIGDAALTGMLTGAVWTAKGSIIGLLSHYFRLLETPNMSVQPHFQMEVTQTSFKCMLQFRIGHAMVAGIKLVKFWKGGRPHFKTKPLSALSYNKTKPV